LDPGLVHHPPALLRDVWWLIDLPDPIHPVSAFEGLQNRVLWRDDDLRRSQPQTKAWGLATLRRMTSLPWWGFCGQSGPTNSVYEMLAEKRRLDETAETRRVWRL
jgi:hypothetical protein